MKIPRRGWGSVTWIGWLVIVLVAACASPVSASVDETSETPTENTSQALLEAIENAIQEEKTQVEALDGQVAQLGVVQDSLASELSAYRFQLAAHSNLLLVAQTPVADLETALDRNQAAVRTVEDRLKTFRDRLKNIAAEKEKTREQLAITGSRIQDLSKARSKEAADSRVLDRLSVLEGLLKDSQERIARLEAAYGEAATQVQELLVQLRGTQGQIEAQLAVRRKTQLFERRSNPFEELGLEAFRADAGLALDRLSRAFTARFWATVWADVVSAGLSAHIAFLLLTFLLFVFSRRCRQGCGRVEKTLDGPAYRYRRVVLRLLYRSIMPSAILVLLILSQVLPFLDHARSFTDFGIRVMLVFLIFRWGKDFLDEWKPVEPTPLQALMALRLNQMLRYLRAVILFYVVFSWIAGSQNLLSVCFRLLLEIGALVWLSYLWRSVRAVWGDRRPDLLFTLRVLSYSGPVVGMLLDLSGFTSLSQFWNQSWGKMAAAAFWSWLVLRCIGEWRVEAAGGGRAEPAPEKASPFRWMLPQLSYLLWGAATLLAVVFAWSDMDVVMSLVRTVYGFSFSIGSIRLSVHGIFFSLVILFVTYLFTRTARHVLNDKVLDHRTLERGLKDSIVTVSSYLIWALGIVLALSVLGVNTTSLAVVFGALSIGIGFGLQNIFNNFISGLILLFERPIQVGDYVEVNGVWAEVKKINVRATVVQTFDNASLIIPNSDFISQQVTNWSFKDPRMRRHVDIGVAYGSDVERVRATLLEIADAVSGVLKYPHPDVIFLDHGDSALVFRLRYWTHVDNYFSTSTAIRFAIDRRFRELGIEIPFPQRDLHIRTVPQEAPPAKGAHTPGDAEAATVGGAGADAQTERDI